MAVMGWLICVPDHSLPTQPWSSLPPRHPARLPAQSVHPPQCRSLPRFQTAPTTRSSAGGTPTATVSLYQTRPRLQQRRRTTPRANRPFRCTSPNAGHARAQRAGRAKIAARARCVLYRAIPGATDRPGPTPSQLPALSGRPGSHFRLVSSHLKHFERPLTEILSWYPTGTTLTRRPRSRRTLHSPRATRLSCARTTRRSLAPAGLAAIRSG